MIRNENYALDLLYESSSNKLKRKILASRKCIHKIEDDNIRQSLIEKLDELHYELDNELFEKYNQK